MFQAAAFVARGWIVSAGALRECVLRGSIVMCLLHVGTIEAADVVSATPMKDSPFLQSYGSELAYSPDGKMLAVGSGNISVWDAKSGEKLHQLEGHSYRLPFRALSALQFTPDSRTLVSIGSGDCRIAFSDVQSGMLTRQLFIPCYLVDTETDLVLGPMPPVSLAISSANVLAVFAYDRTVHLWDAEKGEYLGRLGKPRGEQVEPELFGDLVEDIPKPSRKFRRLPLEFTDVDADLCFSPDGKLLAVGLSDQVAVWEVETRKRKLELPKGGEVEFSLDGRFLVTAGYEGITVWGARTGSEVRHFSHTNKGFTPLQFSPDDRIVATGSVDSREIRVWDFRSGRLIRSLSHAADRLRDLRFSPDGQRIAATLWKAGQVDSRIHIFEVESGLQLLDNR